MAQLLEAEGAGDDDLGAPPRLGEKRPEQMDAGLNDPGSYEVFVTWWTFGGPKRGISPMEAAEMPAWLRQDFGYILAEMRKERKRKEARDKTHGRDKAK